MKQGRHSGLMLIMAALIVFSGVFQISGPARGENPPFLEKTDTTESDYRPGATNPVKNPSRLYLLKDDYLCTLFGNMGDHTLTRNWNTPDNTDLTAWHNHNSAILNEPDYGEINKNVISPTAIASGRLTPEKDSVVGLSTLSMARKTNRMCFWWITPT
ncbi:MAG: hypothetical protein HN366_21360 [Deltaproteobacteria bacterium]|jgi:hypothetical protein|nr:hypothetical protein [Deltaproteobacteria bacterium]